MIKRIGLALLAILGLMAFVLWQVAGGLPSANAHPTRYGLKIIR